MKVYDAADFHRRRVEREARSGIQVNAAGYGYRIERLAGSSEGNLRLMGHIVSGGRAVCRNFYGIRGKVYSRRAGSFADRIVRIRQRESFRVVRKIGAVPNSLDARYEKFSGEFPINVLPGNLAAGVDVNILLGKAADYHVVAVIVGGGDVQGIRFCVRAVKYEIVFALHGRPVRRNKRTVCERRPCVGGICGGGRSPAGEVEVFRGGESGEGAQGEGSDENLFHNNIWK